VTVPTNQEYRGFDLNPGENMPTRVSPMIELGATGLRRFSGYVEEEFLPQLRGRKAVQIYREMADNDPVVGSLLFAIDRLLRRLKWNVEPASQKPEDRKYAEFVESCMNDMSHTWDDFISEVLTMITYGWSFHEIVYKRRLGIWEKNSSKKSQYKDGMIGWRKMPIRSQETWLRWVFDEKGGIQGMVQLAPPAYHTTLIPIDKSLLFRTTTAKNNPEGRSMLRNAYRPWYMKKRLEEIEGIGIERDLAGLPVAKVPADYLTAKPGTEKEKMVQAFRKMVRSVRRDEQEGIILPTAYDQDTKQPLFDFSLLTSGGGRSFNTDQIIRRYEERMLMTVLADFILVGHQGTGSYSMHTDKTGMFRAAINSLAESIADVLNRHAIPRLFALNGWKVDELPRIVPGDVDPPDLGQLATFMTAMQSTGVQWFPDATLENFVRDIARLPKLDDDQERVKEQMTQQSLVIAMANQQMESLNLERQAEAAAAQSQQEQIGLEQSQMSAAQQKMGLDQQMAPPDPEEEQAKGEKDALETEHQKADLEQKKILIQQALNQKPGGKK
jgi:hypothetical protein